MPLILQAPPGPNGPNGVSRPFLLGLLLLILFLSTQTDWSPAARRQRMDIRHGVGTSLLQKQETTREKVPTVNCGAVYGFILNHAIP
mmetsp:Transcript_7794/g.22193  ORF Transcript_7794/g.22193 Transcript_7794/m.22193 type:complete len:87 (+) Transcript_7794:352-612(+)